MTLSVKFRRTRIELASKHPTASMTPEDVIAEAIKYKVYVAFSGGRCSQVALHLAIQQKPDIPVVFNNTGVEYPETVRHVHKIAKEWKLNFIELHPATTFWKIVDKYGFPQLRGSAQKIRKPMCCVLLKEAPSAKYAKENKYEGFIDGVRAEESRPRMFGIAQKGLYYFAKRDSQWKFHPVALWSIEELMDYVDKNKIQINPLYYPHTIAGHPAPALERVGCMPCTGFITWQQILAKQNPKLFRQVNDALQGAKGEPTLWEFYEQNDTCRQDAEI